MKEITKNVTDNTMFKGNGKGDTAAMINSIINCMEDGTLDFARPWSFPETPYNVYSKGKWYHGRNIPAIWAQAKRFGFTDPRWMTFYQARVHPGGDGYRLRYGSKCSYVYNSREGYGYEPHLSGNRKTYIDVFNAEQFSDYPQRDTSKRYTLNIEACTKLINNFNAATLDGGGYVSSHGLIQIYGRAASLGQRNAQHDLSCSFANRVHAISHTVVYMGMTGAYCNSSFGAEMRDYRDLVADIACAYICSDLGIVADDSLMADLIEEHNKMLRGWIPELRKNLTRFENVLTHADTAYRQMLRWAGFPADKCEWA